MKIITDISGQDALRLCDCIEFASKQGLSIGEDTQVGINENSGNVWLWDEDWAGCIYQDIGFSGACFSWSCPDCGEEVDCANLSELNEKQAYFEQHECCEACNDEPKEDTFTEHKL